MSKIALITGITGQDGAYLAELLLGKGYIVHGVKRRSSMFNTARIDHLYQDYHEKGVKFFLHHGDLTDSTNLIRLISEIQPDEIYNLAAQSHVKVSFETPEYTANADAVGTLRLLEAIRIAKLEKKTRFYQASTSEMYGLVQEIPQTETTPFYPRSPYGVAKLYAFWITKNYRESYHKQYGCNFISVMPTNLYGPNDNYDLNNSHVLPALLRKFHDAKESNAPSVTVWGTGSPRREFMHADDMADACVHLMKTYDGDKFVNLGVGVDISIKELALLIKEIVDYQGELVFDTTKPDGTPRKLMDVSYLHSLGWTHKINLEQGIKNVYAEFKENKHLRVV